VTTGRARRQRAEEIAQRYPLLRQFLASYLHQNWNQFHETPQEAIECAIEVSSVEIWQDVRRELRDVLTEKDDAELRFALNDGLGVEIFFEDASEARGFGQEVEQMLLASIEAHFQRRRR
jgi:hypothetical protein